VLNPAFAGTTGEDRINMFYRNQWLTTSAGYHVFGVAYDKSFQNINSGAAIILTNEINGAYVSPTIDLAYSYMITATRNFYLSMSIQAGFTQKYMSVSGLNFQHDGENITNGFNKIIPDFAFGVIGFYKKNLYFGTSVDHIIVPYQGLTKSSNEMVSLKFTTFFGFLHYYRTRIISEQRVLSPNIIVQIQGLQYNINWGVSFQYNSLIGGIWIRHNFKPDFDALILSAGFKTKDYKFAYSYDINIGKRTTVPLGAHEISFTMRFKSNKKKKYKTFKCPKFLD
jgi:type IX secretion system PorP/SprF family membrane protein